MVLRARMFLMNTSKSGKYRWMIFKDGTSWIGVALEFNIVVAGEDPRVVEIELQEAILGYLESAKKLKGFRTGHVNAILNQKPDDEYEKKWIHATQSRKAPERKGVPSPFSSVFYKAGVSSLAVA